MRSSAIFAQIVGSRWLRAAGAACIVLIIALSLIPGRWQERTFLPGPMEHVVAYFGTAAILVMGMRSFRPGVCVGLIAGLSAFSGLMELLQNFSPGRDPQLIDFAASSLGAVCGAVTAYLIRIWLRWAAEPPASA